MKSLKNNKAKPNAIFYHAVTRIEFNRKIIQNKDIPIQYTSMETEYKQQLVRKRK